MDSLLDEGDGGLGEAMGVYPDDYRYR